MPSIHVYRRNLQARGNNWILRGAADLFLRRYSSLVRSAVRTGDENRPTASPAGRYRKIADARVFFARRAASPYCFYEVMQAAAGFDEIGTKPVTPKSMAPPWIDPPHGSIR